MIFLLLSVGLASASDCEPGWSYFNGNCYKHIYNPNQLMNFAPAEAECAARNSYLTSVESPAELSFIAELASRPGDWSSIVDAMANYDPLAAIRTFPTGTQGWRDALMEGQETKIRSGRGPIQLLPGFISASQVSQLTGEMNIDQFAEDSLC